MDSSPSSPTVRSFLPASILLAAAGFSGFVWVVLTTEPSGGTRWLFFFTSVMGLTGLALPVMAFLNRRFPSLPAATPYVILRQAIWAGIYLPTLAWLRIGRAVTPTLALLLALGLLLIEWLLRVGERSQWKPGSRA